MKNLILIVLTVSFILVGSGWAAIEPLSDEEETVEALMEVVRAKMETN